MQNTTKRRAPDSLQLLVGSAPGWYAIWALVAVALRVLFVTRFPMITPDSLVYGDFAKNWLQHHVYGLTQAEGVIPADIRLPGYPAFLALWFAVAGTDHYGAALWAQMVIDVATCFVIAGMAWRIAGERAAKWAFALACICPFTANYTGVALTETLAIFFAALALAFALDGSEALEEGRLRPWIWCGLAIGAGILLRPDGGILLIAIAGWLLWRSLRDRRAQPFRAALIVVVVSLAVLIPWAVRNARTFHRFQPLAPVTAATPDEFFPAGFTRWQRTWLMDYASMEDIGFNVSGESISLEALPARAFDNDEERRRTAELFAAYNESLVMTPELDAGFAELARERIERHPLRYYAWLPVARGLDMWLRPRTEMLPVDVHWWRFADPHDSAVALLLAGLNLMLIAAAVVTLAKRRLRHVGLLLTFVAVRTVVITVIATPEPRYFLECYPVVLALAGAVAQRQGMLRIFRRPQATSAEA